MHKYKLLGKKGEGTFSEVLKAQTVKDGKPMAIKCMKHVFESIEQVNGLREIQALRRLSPHPHIVKLFEVLYDQPTGRLALVFELLECNIYELIKGRTQYLKEDLVKGFMYQVLKAVDHMHRNGIFHRDIKPENMLVDGTTLKLADFGSCRGVYSKQPYTEYISTRWYRAPECLLTDGYYGFKMDLWGIGCVMFEVLALYPLFPGTNETDQIERIHKILGTPPHEVMDKFKKYASAHINFNFAQHNKPPGGLAKLLPHVAPDAVDLLCKLLAYDPEDRITARDSLKHAWFADVREAERKKKAADAAAAAAAQVTAPALGSPITTTQSPLGESRRSSLGNFTSSGAFPPGGAGELAGSLGASPSSGSPHQLQHAHLQSPQGSHSPTSLDRHHPHPSPSATQHSFPGSHQGGGGLDAFSPGRGAAVPHPGGVGAQSGAKGPTVAGGAHDPGLWGAQQQKGQPSHSIETGREALLGKAMPLSGTTTVGVLRGLGVGAQATAAAAFPAAAAGAASGTAAITGPRVSLAGAARQVSGDLGALHHADALARRGSISLGSSTGGGAAGGAATLGQMGGPDAGVTAKQKHPQAQHQQLQQHQQDKRPRLDQGTLAAREHAGDRRGSSQVTTGPGMGGVLAPPAGSGRGVEGPSAPIPGPKSPAYGVGAHMHPLDAASRQLAHQDALFATRLKQQRLLLQEQQEQAQHRRSSVDAVPYGGSGPPGDKVPGGGGAPLLRGRAPYTSGAFVGPGGSNHAQQPSQLVSPYQAPTASVLGNAGQVARGSRPNHSSSLPPPALSDRNQGQSHQPQNHQPQLQQHRQQQQPFQQAQAAQQQQQQQQFQQQQQQRKQQLHGQRVMVGPGAGDSDRAGRAASSKAAVASLPAGTYSGGHWVSTSSLLSTGVLPSQRSAIENTQRTSGGWETGSVGSVFSAPLPPGKGASLPALSSRSIEEPGIRDSPVMGASSFPRRQAPSPDGDAGGDVTALPPSHQLHHPAHHYQQRLQPSPLNGFSSPNAAPLQGSGKGKQLASLAGAVPGGAFARPLQQPMAEPPQQHSHPPPQQQQQQQQQHGGSPASQQMELRPVPLPPHALTATAQHQQQQRAPLVLPAPTLKGGGGPSGYLPNVRYAEAKREGAGGGENSSGMGIAVMGSGVGGKQPPSWGLGQGLSGLALHGEGHHHQQQQQQNGVLRDQRADVPAHTNTKTTATASAKGHFPYTTGPSPVVGPGSWGKPPPLPGGSGPPAQTRGPGSTAVRGAASGARGAGSLGHGNVVRDGRRSFY